jgi:uncharacterized Zn finger protein (UPF0148 family)
VGLEIKISLSEARYCHKCGSALPAGSSYCPGCGTPVTTASVAAVAQQSPAPEPYSRKAYRHEKYEKEEKHEKNEKGEKGSGRPGSIIGPVVGGLIVIWLGVTFYLQEIGSIPSANWWAYFILGIGFILVLQGLLVYSQSRRPFYGPFIGGAILILIGLSFIYNVSGNFWPLILVVIGIAILASALTRGRRPAPV